MGLKRKAVFKAVQLPRKILKVATYSDAGK
jgi:hypothetical protein